MKNRERIEQLESRVSRLEAGTVAPPRPWQVGDVVRLDEPNQLCCREFIGVEATITEVRDNGHIWYTSPKGDSWWPPDHLTLIRPAAAPVDDAAELRPKCEPTVDAYLAAKQTEISELRNHVENLRAEVERLTAECSDLQSHLMAASKECGKFRSDFDNATAERDALRARIEAGRVMYGGMYGHQNKFEMWTFEHVDTDTMTARLIDIAPVAPDERKGQEVVAAMGEADNG